MIIEYLSDFNCPYSYIGLNRIISVCNDLNLDVEWEMKSFELEPKLTNIPSNSIERYAIKNGISVKDAERAIEEIEKIAQNEGIEMNYKNMQLVSSKDAHRIVKYLERYYPELTQKFVLKTFEYNFIKNENIADHDILIEITSSCGLDKNEIKEFLNKKTYSVEVDLDMDEAISNGISTTPYYFINYKDERLMIPGVFEKEAFKIAFEDLINGEMEKKTFL
ncbi:DsbA family oxidoreductase [Methanobrevibacter sp.]|uniref:DsbA family oxidoreductase n=1 Tax=Methanobrevibacter sp. TaxID=66852 RepID=UPI003D7DE540